MAVGAHKRRKIGSQEPPQKNGASARIVTAARGHFFAHGFRRVTMDDLAAELAMSKKTLYAFFPSKRALLRAVLLDKFHRVETDLDRLLTDHSGDFLARLHRLLACLQSHFEEIQPPFVRDVRREAPDMFELVQSRRRIVIQRYFGEIFDAGRRAGIFRKDISSRMMIEILLGATEAIMNPPKLAELGITPKDGYSTIITVVLQGVLTQQGRTAPGKETERQRDKETGRR